MSPRDERALDHRDRHGACVLDRGEGAERPEIILIASGGGEWVGLECDVLGVERSGPSAPGGVTEYRFTVDDVVAPALELLDKPSSAQGVLGLPLSIRACLFDLDGVLTQTAKLHAAAWKQVFDEFLRERSRATGEAFVPFDPVRDYERHVDGKLRVDGASSFLTSRGIHLAEGKEGDPREADTVHGLAARKDDVFGQLLRQTRVATFDGSVRYVRAVRQAGLRTAVVSSSKHCREVLVSAGIDDLFDVEIDGNIATREHFAGKPAPDTYLAAARALGVPPARAAVFEDALAGVEAGRAGHFGHVVGVDRLGQADQLRRHGADIVVTDLAELLEAA